MIVVGGEKSRLLLPRILMDSNQRRDAILPNSNVINRIIGICGVVGVGRIATRGLKGVGLC